jgi:hypothetical protein
MRQAIHQFTKLRAQRGNQFSSFACLARRVAIQTETRGMVRRRHLGGATDIHQCLPTAMRMWKPGFHGQASVLTCQLEPSLPVHSVPAARPHARSQGRAERGTWKPGFHRQGDSNG